MNASGVIDSSVSRSIGNTDKAVIKNGCYNGRGILVFTTTSAPAHVTVLDSNVHDYESEGIYATVSPGGSLTVDVQTSTVTGLGSAPALEAGIVFSDGVKGSITGSTVTDNEPFCNSSGYCSTPEGIVIQDLGGADGVKVTGNVVGNNAFNIVYFGSSGDVEDNISFSATYDTLDLIGNNNIAQRNRVNSAGLMPGQAGAYICGNDNYVAHNYFNEVTVGVYDDPTPGSIESGGCESGSGNSAYDNHFRNTSVYGLPAGFKADVAVAPNGVAPPRRPTPQLTLLPH